MEDHDLCYVRPMLSRKDKSISSRGGFIFMHFHNADVLPVLCACSNIFNVLNAEMLYVFGYVLVILKFQIVLAK